MMPSRAMALEVSSTDEKEEQGWQFRQVAQHMHMTQASVSTNELYMTEYTVQADIDMRCGKHKLLPTCSTAIRQATRMLVSCSNLAHSSDMLS
jgi:hypothetical protein